MVVNRRSIGGKEVAGIRPLIILILTVALVKGPKTHLLVSCWKIENGANVFIN